MLSPALSHIPKDGPRGRPIDKARANQRTGGHPESPLRRVDKLQPIAGAGQASAGRLRCGLAPGVIAALAATRIDWGIPFLAGPDYPWTVMNRWLLAIAATASLAVFAHACYNLSVRDGLLMLALGVGVSLAAEYTGLRWHLPFGYHYAYDPALQPLLLGQVPATVPPLWFVFCYAPLVFLRRFSVRLRGRLDSRRVLLKTGLCALYLMAIDLFLDPLGVSSGAWTWPEGGLYFGIPLLNFAGWFVVGVAIYLPYFLLARDSEGPRRRGAAGLDAAMAAVFIGVTVLCFLACLVRLGTWIPTLLAGAIIVPCWGYWLTGTPVARPCSRMGRWIRLGGRLEPVAEDAESRER